MAPISPQFDTSTVSGRLRKIGAGFSNIGSTLKRNWPTFSSAPQTLIPQKAPPISSSQAMSGAMAQRQSFLSGGATTQQGPGNAPIGYNPALHAAAAQRSQTPVKPQILAQNAGTGIIPPAGTNPPGSPVLPPLSTTPTGNQGSYLTPEQIKTQNAGTAGASQPSVVSPTTPTTPKVDPYSGAISDFQKEYLKYLSPSERENALGVQSAEENAKLAELQSNALLGSSGLEGQGRGIPLQLVRGQQSKLMEQAALKSIPMQERMAVIEAQRVAESNKRQASLEASKFGLEQSQKAQEASLAAAKGERDESRQSAADIENKRRWEAEQQAAKDKTAADAKQAVITNSLSEKKYQEDVRQFGVTSAQNNRKIAIDEAKAVAEAGGDKKKSELLSNYQIASDVLSNYGAISGPIQTGSIPFTGGAETKNKYNQLVGLLKLENRQKLKGQGQISDFEGKILADASTALGRNLSESSFQKELVKIRGAFATAAGLEANVKVTSPNGESHEGSASRAEIDKLIAEGNNIEYQ